MEEKVRKVVGNISRCQVENCSACERYTQVLLQFAKETREATVRDCADIALGAAYQSYAQHDHPERIAKAILSLLKPETGERGK